MKPLSAEEIQNLQALLCSADENSVVLGLELLKQHEEAVPRFARPLILLYYFHKPKKIVSTAKRFLQKYVFKNSVWRDKLNKEIIVLIRMGGNSNYYNYFYRYKYWNEKAEMLKEMQGHIPHFETYRQMFQGRSKFYGRLYLNIANHLKHHKSYDLGLLYYQYAQIVNLNQGEAYFHYAHILQTKYIQKGKRQEDYQEVVDNYQKAFNINSHNLSCYMNTAILYEEMDRMEEAIDYYSRILKIKPEHVGALNNLANIYMKLQDFDHAKSYVLRAHKVQPKDVHVLDSYAHILMLGFQNLKDAEILFKQVIELNDDHHYSFTGLGDLYKQQGEYALAEKHYLRGIQKGGLFTTKDVQELLEKFEKLAAFYFYDYNQSKLAKKYCKKMLKLRPNHTFALKLLNQINQKLI
ncbi:MAG: tetratricopeptide repeat protein [Aureispira sp.]|nr:tetratricopeptide repeat protein [Aureispira sp.]